MTEFLVQTESTLIQEYLINRNDAIEVAEWMAQEYETNTHVLDADNNLIHNVSFGE
jgi:hypothetical protein